VKAVSLHVQLVERLRQLRGPDGGFPTSPGGVSEVEPTVVASLALSDATSRQWLADHLRGDGGVVLADGRVDGPTSSALVALALSNRGSAKRALAYAISRRGLPPPNADEPQRRVAWGWTPDARSLVEPTARVLLAVNAVTPTDTSTRREAIGLLRERQCADGGWNYGNASHIDVDLRGYAQTTAIALVSLQGVEEPFVATGIEFLRRTWRDEPGGHTTAQALLAFRLRGIDDEIQPAIDTLASMADDASFGRAPVTVAWAVLATGPEELLEPLRSRA
jgi:hypothetical protein